MGSYTNHDPLGSGLLALEGPAHYQHTIEFIDRPIAPPPIPVSKLKTPKKRIQKLRTITSLDRSSSQQFCEKKKKGMDSPSYQEDEDDHESVLQKQEWVKTQHLLRSKLILEDDFVWTLSSGDLNPDGSNKKEKLKYIGGVDISFLKEDPSTACAAVVVLDADTLEVVHEEFDAVRLQVPYIPGFLAFREAPILLGLLEKMRTNAHPFYPQLLMVDGNGLLHPRGFGLACHLGVLASLPTIGVGKNLHHVDGLSQSEVRRQLEAKENHDKELIPLTGHSGTPWGMAMRSCPGSSKPIYISIGHRISLDSAVRIVKLCCKYRVPEPIRQADIRSKVFLQKHQRGLLQ